MYDQMTVVVGIDAKTIQQFKVSHKTWFLHRPEMRNMRWVIFWDWTSIAELEIKHLDKMLALPKVQWIDWPSPQCPPKASYESQREMMLTGHVFVPAKHVETPWSMKIDTDVVAHGRPCEWLQEQWFDETCDTKGGTLECDADCEVRYVAPSWHYSKGVNFLGLLEEWGDGVCWGPCNPTNKRLNLPNYDPTALRFGHKRMCSWVSYYNVSFLQWLCRELERTVGYGKLPVPSQDTTVWYAAAREMWPEVCHPNHRLVNMKKLGWDNVSKLQALAERCKSILEAAHICAE